MSYDPPTGCISCGKPLSTNNFRCAKCEIYRLRELVEKAFLEGFETGRTEGEFGKGDHVAWLGSSTKREFDR